MTLWTHAMLLSLVCKSHSIKMELLIQRMNYVCSKSEYLEDDWKIIFQINKRIGCDVTLMYCQI